MEKFKEDSNLSLFKIFQIDLMNFFKTRVILMEQLHVQPSEIDKFPFYEYEYTIEAYEQLLKERKEDQDKQRDEYDEKYGNPSKMGNDMISKAKSGFKMPSMPNINIPKI